MRVFIGIALDYDVREYLQSVQNVIKQTAYEGNFTDIDNFHITLKFIGEINPNDLDMIESALEEALQNTPQFTIQVGDIGYFKRGRKKLIFVKITKNQTVLKTIHQKLVNSLKKHEVELLEQKFTPHITIARQVSFKEFVNASMPIPMYNDTISVKTVTLFQSSRINGKLKYTPLYHFNLE